MLRKGLLNSLYLNYSEVLNHNLRKRSNISLHLLRAEKSLEQGEHPPSKVVAGTDKRAVLQHSVTCPAHSEVMKPCGPKVVGPPKWQISWSACGHSKQCETPCWGSENRVLKISKASEQQLQYVSLVCLESNCLERSGQKSQMLDLSSWDISKITQEILLYLKHFSKSTASF